MQKRQYITSVKVVFKTPAKKSEKETALAHGPHAYALWVNKQIAKSWVKVDGPKQKR